MFATELAFGLCVWMIALMFSFALCKARAR